MATRPCFGHQVDTKSYWSSKCAKICTGDIRPLTGARIKTPKSQKREALGDVLLLGDDARVAVVAARSFAQRGIQVDVAYTGYRHWRSRAVRNFIRSNDNGRNAFSSTDILSLGASGRYRLMIPCNDLGLSALAECYNDLDAMGVQVASPDPQIISNVLNKSKTLDLAKQLEIPVPKYFYIKNPADLDAASAEILFPAVAKPQSKRQRNEHKVLYLEDRVEALRLADEITHWDSGLILQEYCRGEGVGVEVFLHDGEVRLLFQHRRLLEQPASGGVSVVAISEKVDPKLAEYAIRLLRALKWEGVAMVEFRQDKNHADCALMEVNGRLWGTLALSIHCGVDFPYAIWQMYFDSVSSIKREYTEGTKFRWTAGLIQRFIEQTTNPAPKWLYDESRFTTAINSIRQLSPFYRDAIWSWSDPGPYIYEITEGLRRTASNIFPPGLRALVKGILGLSGSEKLVYVKGFARSSARKRADLLAIRRKRGIRTVLFVCHGNMMRSAAAEAFFLASLDKKGVSGINVLSSGTNVSMESADSRAIRTADRFGVDLRKHVPTQMNGQLARDSDLIIAFDRFNEAKLLGKFPDAKGKVFLISEFDTENRGRRASLRDPFFGSEGAVRQCFGKLHGYVKDLAVVIVNDISDSQESSPDRNGPPA